MLVDLVDYDTGVIHGYFPNTETLKMNSFVFKSDLIIRWYRRRLLLYVGTGCDVLLFFLLFFCSGS